MTPAERGGYIDLLCFAWDDPDCCLPDDDAILAQLSRLGPAWDGCGAKIRRCFSPDPERPGFIFNPRQRQEKTNQAERVQKSREQKVNAANARWHPDRKPQCDRNATASPPDCDRNATASEPQSARNASYSTYSTPLPNRQSLVDKGDQASANRGGKKLTTAQKGLADRFEAALGAEWVNDAGKWVNRIKADRASRELADSVLCETESAIKESRIKKTPAHYAEDLWKRWEIKK